jgi:predicted 2-oxoglutarate/Fe(II)-dependent dioxygenase YbiX
MTTSVKQRQNNAYAKHVAHIRDAHARRRAALQKLADAVNDNNKYFNATNNRAYDEEGFTYYNAGSNSNENLRSRR